MIKLDAWLINLKTMGKYTFGEGKIRPVIQGGIAMSYVNNSSSRYISYKLTDFYKISTIFVGFDIGTGFNYMLKNTRALFLRGDFVWQKDTAQGKLYSFQLKDRIPFQIVFPTTVFFGISFERVQISHHLQHRQKGFSTLDTTLTDP